MSEQTRVHPTPAPRLRERRGLREAARGPRARYALALCVLVGVAVALVMILAGGGSRHVRAHSGVARAAHASSASAPAGGTAAGGAAAGGTAAQRTGAAGVGVTGPVARGAPRKRAGELVGGARKDVAEVADPEEASSYPAPASARHSAAKAPAKAGEAVVAAGAPSDAEVKSELAQMHAVERAAAKQEKQRLTPVAGGESIGGNGTIPIPTNIPEVVQRVIAGANEIADFPYVFGGGHGSFIDNAYDCSGSVSYALAAGGLLGRPETSGELEGWGASGPGRYITVLANPGHTYMYVDGVLFDTAGRSGVYASRWQVQPTDNSGYVVRHWPGL